MAKAYYSTVLNNTVEEVWRKISNFNDDRWSGEVTETSSDNDKSGSTVGAIRFHKFSDKTARSDLRTYSAAEHFFTYGFIGKPPVPIQNYEATIRVTPIVDGDKAFVEWFSTFDCAEGEHQKQSASLAASYKRWLGSLAEQLT